jgi:hypothetical protein
VGSWASFKIIVTFTVPTTVGQVWSFEETGLDNYSKLQEEIEIVRALLCKAS